MTPNEQLAGTERAAYVVGRRADRVSFRQIGTELGISPQRVHTIWSRALRELPAPRLHEHRNEEAELIDTAVRELLVIARDPRYRHARRSKRGRRSEEVASQERCKSPDVGSARWG